MSYIDGFVAAVPKAKKQAFIEHARKADEVFLEYGAIRVMECWGDQVPEGKQTDFYRAVQAQADEEIVFSWTEWPDQASRDRAFEQMETVMREDPRMNPETNPMPFDGARMIFGGFSPVVELTRAPEKDKQNA